MQGDIVDFIRRLFEQLFMPATVSRGVIITLAAFGKIEPIATGNQFDRDGAGCSHGFCKSGKSARILVGAMNAPLPETEILVAHFPVNDIIRLWMAIFGTKFAIGVVISPLQYSTQLAASWASPVPLFTVICGSAPIRRQNWINSSVPKRLYSDHPRHGF